MTGAKGLPPHRSNRFAFSQHRAFRLHYEYYWNWRRILSYNMANVDEAFWTSVQLFRLRS